MTSPKMKGGTPKVSPPAPTFMSDQQLSHYLRDLRTNRPPRPNGSRPLPSNKRTTSPAPSSRLPPRASSALSMGRPSDQVNSGINSTDQVPRASSSLSHHRATSEVSSLSGSAGTTTIPETGPYRFPRNTSPTATMDTTATSPVKKYRENDQRLVERQEARSLRSALEEMDMQDDEKRLHTAAQDEATELVLEHQTRGFPKKEPHAPYKNPDLNYVNRFRQQLERGDHAKSKSLSEASRRTPHPGSHHSASDSSNASSTGHDTDELHGILGRRSTDASVPKDAPTLDGSFKRKPKVNFALPGEDIPPNTQPPSSGHRGRTVSGDSSKGVFNNPEDHIYEEPEEHDENDEPQTRQNTTKIPALTIKPRNSVPRGARPLPNRWKVPPPKEKFNRSDIHRNPPTQSRNPLYKANIDPLPVAAPDCDDEDSPPTKDGVEIRSDDIRAATSMRLKDRSTKLPMPSIVSDRPGRPIVSFDRNWKSHENEESARPLKSEPGQGAEKSFPKDSVEPLTNPPKDPIPAINVIGATIPTISIGDEDSAKPETHISPLGPPISAMKRPGETSVRPLPEPGKHNRKGSAQTGSAATSISRKQQHQTLTGGGRGAPTAACAFCGLTISGRIVTASSYRLHPECFSCYHCSTPLECVAFYQEPENKREVRLSNTETHEQDSETPRFYCHLDFHELFSPRCKSCKTPIEGEVILACGAEWHVGHFFCAECGDPFSSTTPFVEKAGFAWCVRCHSRRTASKCRGCKQPVLDETVVTAIGAQWHDKCFVCHECKGSFGSEGRFFVRQGKPRVTARGRQIGGPVEHAVCESCEARRLKA